MNFDAAGKWKLDGDEESKANYIACFEFNDGFMGVFGKNTFALQTEPKEGDLTEAWAKAKPKIEAKMEEAFTIAKEHRERKAGFPVYDKSIEELNKELIPGLNKELDFYMDYRVAHMVAPQYVPHLIIR
eukprot:CAMPEP_0181123066 /NCGR_PEP_ID=MMETSP1071-20121207/25673_1 /TAXON_ID=35127 /ORGANISM="Thalassiosira sp., Strain NH16" /LENGTH=128 /DNA_ID=CAMNT_0023208127 /DNA_START=33 /DNA_END=415 /DNA_ORIENTATION=+